MYIATIFNLRRLLMSSFKVRAAKVIIKMKITIKMTIKMTMITMMTMMTKIIPRHSSGELWGDTSLYLNSSIGASFHRLWTGEKKVLLRQSKIRSLHTFNSMPHKFP